MPDIQVELSADVLNMAECIAWTMSPEAGGIDVFIGTVRNSTKGRTVIRLDFEAYEPMAISELGKICRKACDTWPVNKVLVHHRTGSLAVGEIPVIIAVAAAHRHAAFQACRYIIDTLKQTVPIWKKEIFEDGEVWVSATP